MGVVTSQKISVYYDQYRDKEIAFTKDILKTLGVDPRQIYVKCNGVQWPCIINSISLMNSRIILGTKGGAYAQLTKTESVPVSLRLFFLEPGNQAMSFFVSAHVTNVAPYMDSDNLAIVTLTYSQRPPDDLIEKIGVLLETNANAIRRREDRIIINDESKRKLGLTKAESIIYIQNVPRHCVIRDLSFFGAKVILIGVPKFLESKDIVLCLLFDDVPNPVVIKGTILHASRIEGRKDLIFVNIKFEENSVPFVYKLHINTYLSTVHIKQLSAAEQLAKKQQELAKEAFSQKAKGAAQPAASNNAPAANQAASPANTETPAPQPEQTAQPAADGANPQQPSAAEQAPAASAESTDGTNA